MEDARGSNEHCVRRKNPPFASSVVPEDLMEPSKRTVLTRPQNCGVGQSKPKPHHRDWRRQGEHTVLGEIGPDDHQGLRRVVQAGADEVVIIRKNGQIKDVFSESRKPTRSFAEFLISLVGLGPNIEVYKATKTRFNIIFWLGDEETTATGQENITFGLPVLTRDNQIIPARINLWIQIDEDLAENTLLLLRGNNHLSRSSIGSEIRYDLHSKVLGLELGQYSFNELRGNGPLLRDLGESIKRELSGSLAAFGLLVQDYSISWGLTLEERAELDKRRHLLSLEELRTIHRLNGPSSNTSAGEQSGLTREESTMPSRTEVVLALDHKRESRIPSSTVTGQINPEQNLLLGDEAYEKGLFEEALKHFNQAIETDPQYSMAFSSRAAVFCKLGDHKLGVKDCDKAVELDPSNSQAYENLAALHIGLGLNRKALEDYDRAILLNPDSYISYTGRGVVCYSLGQYRQSLNDFGRAIEINPNYSGAYRSRAAAYHALGEYKQAFKDLDQIIQFDPQSAPLYNDRGTAYYKIGDERQAIMDFDKVIDLNPSDGYAYYWRGKSQESLGHSTLANEDLEQAYQLGYRPD